jgi:hypothetical protein
MLTAWWLFAGSLKRRYVLAFFEKLGPCLVGVCQFIGVGVQYCIDVPIDTASDRSAADGPRRIEHNERNRPDRQTCAELDELRQLCLLAHGRD